MVKSVSDSPKLRLWKNSFLLSVWQFDFRRGTRSFSKRITGSSPSPGTSMPPCEPSLSMMSLITCPLRVGILATARPLRIIAIKVRSSPLLLPKTPSVYRQRTPYQKLELLASIPCNHNTLLPVELCVTPLWLSRSVDSFWKYKRDKSGSWQWCWTRK